MANVMTPPFRVSYPAVFQAKKNDLNDKMEYSVVALFKKGEDLSKLKKAVQECIEAKLGTDKNKWPKNLRSPFRDQAERKKTTDDGKEILPDGYEEGAIFISMKSSQRPGVVDQNVQPIIDESMFYAGCFAHATVNPYYYDNKGNRGVAFGLQNIQKLRDGDPLSGRTKAETDFAPVQTEGSSSTDLFN
jgi:hypothetical protein